MSFLCEGVYMSRIIQKSKCHFLRLLHEEISHLKYYSKILLAQIKKSNDTKQCIQKLEQDNQDLQKKLSEKKRRKFTLKEP